jgi:hypothetical protein
MRQIKIPNYPSETWLLVDGEWEPQHEDAEVEPPCCSGIDSEGNPSCACHGQYSVYCPAIDCPGIADYQVDALIEAGISDPDDYDDERWRDD